MSLSSPVIMYGIPNCDTIKKAKKWLEAEAIAYEFYDYKKLGVDAERLNGWCENTDWEMLLNKAGTTFRKLPDEIKANIDKTSALALMVENPSMIKRPVLEANGRLLVGFKPEWYADFFAQET